MGQVVLIGDALLNGIAIESNCVGIIGLKFIRGGQPVSQRDQRPAGFLSEYQLLPVRADISQRTALAVMGLLGSI